MDVLKALDARGTSSMKKGAKAKAPVKGEKKTHLSPKPHLSEDEIRKKVEESKKPVVPALQKPVTSSPQVSSTMSEDFDEIHRRGEEAKRALAQKKQAEVDLKGPEEEVELRRSDVGRNDPTDPATAGKLKDLLSRGAFKFSDKERDALSKILT